MMIGTSSTGGSSGFNRYFAMVLKTNNAATIPSNGTTFNRPNWQLASNSTGTNTLSMTNRTFRISNATSSSVRQTFTNTVDANCFQDITYDSPRIGMISRASNTNTAIVNGISTACFNNPVVGLRGNGWSISGGTTLLSNYPNITPNTARFYSINIAY